MRRSRRTPRQSVGRQLRSLAIQAIYIAVALVVMYFAVNWALGNVLDASMGVMRDMQRK